MKSIARQISDIDSRLLLAASRLARYRVSGPGTSVVVQRGVIDRMLDERLVLMAERDGT